MRNAIPKFFATGVFVMALLGAFMTSSLDRDYSVGGITAHAIYDSSIVQSSVEMSPSSSLSFFGFFLAGLTLVSLLVIGYLSLGMYRESEEEKVGLKGVVHLDHEIDAITKELQNLN